MTTCCDEGQAEVIEFLRPDRNDQNVFVTNLPKTLTDSAKYEQLSSIFSQFGLIYEVQVLESAFPAPEQGLEESSSTGADSSVNKGSKTGDEPAFCHYAFVTFYSALAAARAIRSLHQQWMVDGHVLRVQRGASQQAPARNSVHLYVSECRKLANHYLGFNGWSSKIIKLESFSVPDAATLDLLADLADEAEDSATFVPGQDQLCYSCVMQLTFPQHHITCHGCGTATVRPPKDDGIAGPIVSAGYAKKGCPAACHRRCVQSHRAGCAAFWQGSHRTDQR
eukprot:scpid77156/ scgid5701/ RAD52 motif-containing protein 1